MIDTDRPVVTRVPETHTMGPLTRLVWRLADRLEARHVKHNGGRRTKLT